MSVNKEQRFGIISTILFLIGFTGMLFLFGFKTEAPQDEEGILINFGTSDFGAGAVEPRPTPDPVPQESVPEPVSTPEPVTNNEATEEVLNQDYEESAAIEQKKKEEQEAKEKQAEIDRQKEIERQKQLERERLAEEKRQREEAERKEIEKLTQNAFGGQNPTGDNTGEGTSSGNGNQGASDGSVDSQNRAGGGAGNGISFSLGNRKNKSLPKPVYTAQAEGKVVVEIKVDQNGNVISARAGVKGTTTSDKKLQQAAYQAAMKATFNVDKSAPAQQVGTITYHFVLQ